MFFVYLFTYKTKKFPWQIRLLEKSFDLYSSGHGVFIKDIISILRNNADGNAPYELRFNIRISRITTS